ncbi:sodium:solute symporter family protein [Haloechinothrix salitolerans]|uniref:Sodium:solute symporter family protein n=1 Tax=Haloechinothrix salitolerans TaxID=926830 RepID=A0ABW2C3P5_9PSEU
MIWYAFYIALFIVVMFGIGLYHFKHTKGADDYLIAGWNVGAIKITLTVIATWAGASIFIGSVGLGYEFGLSGYMRFALPGAFFSLLLILLFAKKLRRTKLYTVPDIFDERFGKPAGVIPAILSVCLYAAPVTAMQIVALGALFNVLFGMPLGWGVLLGWAIVYGYTMLGGLPSVIITDSIQTVVLVVGLVIMGVATWVYAGGMAEIAPAIPGTHLNPAGADPSATLIFALTIGPFYLIWQSSWQRIYAARTERVALWGNAVGIALAGFVISVIPIFIGMAARSFVPGDNVRPDSVFYIVLQDILPPYVGGILAMALMAALVSGGDSFLLQGTANLTRDLYQRHLRPDASQEKLLKMSRWGVTVIGLAALLIAFFITDIVGIYTYTLKWSAVALVLPFLAVMFWRRATRFGVITSMIAGLTATIGWELAGNPFGITEILPGYLVGAAALLLGSLLTKHAASEQVKAIWYDGLQRQYTLPGARTETGLPEAQETQLPERIDAVAADEPKSG